MTGTRRLKVSISLDAKLVGVVDRFAASQGATRSAVIERWLTEASRQSRTTQLAEETAAYYDALTNAEREEDAGWSSAVAESARRLRIDEPATVRAPPRRRRHSESGRR